MPQGAALSLNARQQCELRALHDLAQSNGFRGTERELLYSIIGSATSFGEAVDANFNDVVAHGALRANTCRASNSPGPKARR